MKRRLSVASLLACISVLLFAVSLTSACASKKVDTSQLSAQGLHDYKADQVVKLVNDVTISAITANKVGKLSDDTERVVLTINKQVLDVVAANPAGFKSQALAVLKNSRDALSLPQQATADAYLQQVLAILNGWGTK